MLFYVIRLYENGIPLHMDTTVTTVRLILNTYTFFNPAYNFVTVRTPATEIYYFLFVMWIVLGKIMFLDRRF